MRIHPLLIATALLLSAIPPAAGAQEGSGAQRITVPLSNPGQPVVLIASLFKGGVTVTGYDGRDVIVEAIPARDGGEGSSPGGMKRIPSSGLGLTIEEQDNNVTVHGALNGNLESVAIQVPRRTSMKVSCVNGGDIEVRDVEGELELQNTNGGILALSVSGEVVAHTTNGEVRVTFERIEQGRAMSFVTFNGNVDVTFPPGLKADLRISTDQGEIFTDFEFQVKSRPPRSEGKRQDGRFQVDLNQDVEATIGGGGPEMYFKTWSGNIFIRKIGA